MKKCDWMTDKQNVLTERKNSLNFLVAFLFYVFNGMLCLQNNRSEEKWLCTNVMGFEMNAIRYTLYGVIFSHDFLKCCICLKRQRFTLSPLHVLPINKVYISKYKSFFLSLIV